MDINIINDFKELAERFADGTLHVIMIISGDDDDVIPYFNPNKHTDVRCMNVTRQVFGICDLTNVYVKEGYTNRDKYEIGVMIPPNDEWPMYEGIWRANGSRIIEYDGLTFLFIDAHLFDFDDKDVPKRLLDLSKYVMRGLPDTLDRVFKSDKGTTVSKLMEKLETLDEDEE
jgi:hypothetical protein